MVAQMYYSRKNGKQWARIGVSLGGVQINVFINGRGESRLDLTQVANLVKKCEKAARLHLASKTFKVKWAKASTDRPPVIKIAAPTGGYWSLVHSEAAIEYLAFEAFTLHNPWAMEALKLLAKESLEIRIMNALTPITGEEVAKIQSQTTKWQWHR